MKGGDVGIHFVLRNDSSRPSGVHNSKYIFVHDVDAIYNELKGNDIRIANPIGDRDYRMRDFDIQDVDGYIITPGTDLDQLALLV